MEAKIGDVYQIDPEYDKVFGGCFLTVSEAKKWGVAGYFNIPSGDDAIAFYRCKYENMVKIGEAQWARQKQIGEKHED